jgi:Flp pilus assembly pilin Flp
MLRRMSTLPSVSTTTTERGQTMAEYAVVLALLAATALAAFALLGTSVSTLLTGLLP